MEQYVEAIIKITEPNQVRTKIMMKEEGWDLINEKKGEHFLGLAEFELTFCKTLKKNF